MANERLTDRMRSDAAGLARSLAEQFPASPPDPSEPYEAAPVRGGRVEATRRLAEIDPAAYARSRNFLTGRVTRLSPWIRHGVVSLAEVRDRALAACANPDDASKLVSELGWRDYWQRVYASVGERIWHDLEPPAAERRSPVRETCMPDDVLRAKTGMACIDAFVAELHRTGHLHNHARMWLASWLVHVRGVRWQAGASWFLSHLVDGDPASNNLSWQWVAGTFSAKPYLFNRENLERYTEAAFCKTCELFGRCDVEGGYEDLTERLFDPTPPVRPKARVSPAAAWSVPSARVAEGPPIVWLTLDSLSDTSPAAAAHPSAPRVFVLDPGWLEAERPAAKRLRFVLECLIEMPGVEVFLGDPVEVLSERLRAHGASRIAIAETPCPRVRRQAARIVEHHPVEVRRWPRFCDDRRVDDLTRFSRYWQRAAASAMRPTESQSS